MFSQDEDQDQKVALIVVAALVTLIIAGVIAFSAMSGSSSDTKNNAATTASTSTIEQNKDAGATANAAATSATATLELKDDESKVIVENGVVKFYFASGKADLAAGANDALADVVKGIKAGQKATISGYHDSTGDPAKNAELAKKRATSVRDAIVALGVPADALELKKPEQMEIKGNNAQARRVEVTLVK